MGNRSARISALLKTMGIGIVTLLFSVGLGCAPANAKPQETLDKLMAAAKAGDQVGLEALLAKGSILDTNGFLETKESLNTQELTRRIKLRALVEAVLARMEAYTVENEKEVDVDSRILSVMATIGNPQGPSEKFKCRFLFLRQGGMWKLAEWL